MEPEIRKSHTIEEIQTFRDEVGRTVFRFEDIANHQVRYTGRAEFTNDELRAAQSCEFRIPGARGIAEAFFAFDHCAQVAYNQWVEAIKESQKPGIVVASAMPPNPKENKNAGK